MIGFLSPAVPAIALAAAIALTAQPAAAATLPARGQQCTACHGRTGQALSPQYPNLAGQNAIYLAAQLRAFRAGDRRSDQMNLVAKDLSDADIDALADYFESSKPACGN